ncbi:hypothetical protein D3C85_1445560 [compost metagenome]
MQTYSYCRIKRVVLIEHEHKPITHCLGQRPIHKLRVQVAAHRISDRQVVTSKLRHFHPTMCRNGDAGPIKMGSDLLYERRLTRSSWAEEHAAIPKRSVEPTHERLDQHLAEKILLLRRDVMHPLVSFCKTWRLRVGIEAELFHLNFCIELHFIFSVLESSCPRKGESP